MTSIIREFLGITNRMQLNKQKGDKSLRALFVRPNICVSAVDFMGTLAENVEH